MILCVATVLQGIIDTHTYDSHASHNVICRVILFSHHIDIIDAHTSDNHAIPTAMQLMMRNSVYSYFVAPTTAMQLMMCSYFVAPATATQLMTRNSV